MTWAYFNSNKSFRLRRIVGNGLLKLDFKMAVNAQDVKIGPYLLSYTKVLLRNIFKNIFVRFFNVLISIGQHQIFHRLLKTCLTNGPITRKEVGINN